MPSLPPYARPLVLSVLFLLAAGLDLVLVRPKTEPAPRWPTDDVVFAVPGWSVGPQDIQEANGVRYVTRQYERQVDDLTLSLVLSTSPEAKRIYRAGPEVPFLGNGYSVEPTAGGGFLAQRGAEAWLQVDAYGERRGLLGNGPLAWGLAVADTVIGEPNDYYLARVIGPAGTDQAPVLAEAVFPRLAGWYGHVSS